jgi:hypothetical protein
MQQVQQELQLQVIPCQQQQQQWLCAADAAEEEADDWDVYKDGQPSSTASSSCFAFESSPGHLDAKVARAYHHQQQQRYSITRTGGGFQACDIDPAAQAAEGLLRSAAVHSQLLSATAAAGSSSSCNAKLAASLPKEVIAVMQDFYRQHCCVQWPLAKAARCVSASAAAAGSKSPAAAVQSAFSPARAAAAGGAGGAGGDVSLQPLLPWHVLEGLLVLLNRVRYSRAAWACRV